MACKQPEVAVSVTSRTKFTAGPTKPLACMFSTWRSSSQSMPAWSRRTCKRHAKFLGAPDLGAPIRRQTGGAVSSSGSRRFSCEECQPASRRWTNPASRSREAGSSPHGGTARSAANHADETPAGRRSARSTAVVFPAKVSRRRPAPMMRVTHRIGPAIGTAPRHLRHP